MGLRELVGLLSLFSCAYGEVVQAIHIDITSATIRVDLSRLPRTPYFCARTLLIHVLPVARWSGDGTVVIDYDPSKHDYFTITFIRHEYQPDWEAIRNHLDNPSHPEELLLDSLLRGLTEEIEKEATYGGYCFDLGKP